MKRKWNEADYPKPEFDLDDLMKRASVISSEAALKDVPPIEWPEEVISGEKSVYVTEKGICVE